MNNNNIYIELLDKYHNFNLSKEDAKMYLINLNHKGQLNNHIFNEINYELLITIDILYQNDEEIQNLLIDIKNKISKYFILKNKLIHKYHLIQR